MKMVKGLQDHDFNYKLPNGESLSDVGCRLNNFVKGVINQNKGYDGAERNVPPIETIP